MNLTRKSTLALAAGMLALPAFAQITFYEHDGYRGRTFSASVKVSRFERWPSDWADAMACRMYVDSVRTFMDPTLLSG